MQAYLFNLLLDVKYSALEYFGPLKLCTFLLSLFIHYFCLTCYSIYKKNVSKICSSYTITLLLILWDIIFTIHNYWLCLSKYRPCKCKSLKCGYLSQNYRSIFSISTLKKHLQVEKYFLNFQFKIFPTLISNVS